MTNSENTKRSVDFVILLLDQPDKPCQITRSLQKVRLQGGMCPEKCQFDQYQNSRLVAIIDFIMQNISETVQIAKTNSK